MADDRFWELIERSVPYGRDQERQVEALAAALGEIPVEEIPAFEAAFVRQMRRSYDWNLWGAGYVVTGGMSDDGFEYFRYWLISRGRDDFTRILADPDDLGALISTSEAETIEFEGFGYVARDVWIRRGGKDLEDSLSGSDLSLSYGDPSGAPFEDDEADLAARYPKLWARFGHASLP